MCLRDDERGPVSRVRVRVILCCLEKLRERVVVPPVPQTDSGVQVENTKEIERIVVKELGKMPP